MNLSSLDQPVSKQEIVAFAASHKPIIVGMNAEKFGQILGAIVLVSFVAGFFLLVAATGQLGSSGSLMAGVMVGVIAFLSLIIIPPYVYFSRKKKANDAIVGVKLSRLAAVNGWGYTYNTTAPRYRSTIFDAGYSYIFAHVIQAPEFQLGKCSFKIGEGRNEREYHYGYMVLTLDRAMPHMLLDSTSNNISLFGINISNIPVTINRDQIVSLEGDFDKYYTLYAPKDYDVDVRYVFTPDVMQLLIQESDSTDMEIVDDKLYVYFGKYDLGAVQFWQRVERLQTMLADKIVERVDHYTDDRTVDGAVAMNGKRLRTGISVISVVIIIIYIALQIARFVGDSDLMR